MVQPCQCDQNRSSNGSQANSTFLNPNDINFKGPGQGQAFANTNNPLQNISNWIDDEETRKSLNNPYNWEKNINEGKWVIGRTTPACPYAGNSATKPDGGHNPENVYEWHPTESKPWRRPGGHNPKNAYEWYIDIGQTSGVDFSKYFTAEEFNKNPWEMTTDELIAWHSKFDKFIAACYGSDPMFKAYEGFKGELKTELINMGINAGETLVATGLTIASGGLLGPVAGTVTNIVGGAVVASTAETARQYNEGKSFADGTVDVNRVVKAGAAGGLSNVSLVDAFENKTLGKAIDMAKNVGIAYETEKSQGGTNKDAAVEGAKSVSNDMGITPLTDALSE